MEPIYFLNVAHIIVKQVIWRRGMQFWQLGFTIVYSGNTEKHWNIAEFITYEILANMFGSCEL